jgi:hypothetical protein
MIGSTWGSKRECEVVYSVRIQTVSGEYDTQTCLRSMLGHTILVASAVGWYSCLLSAENASWWLGVAGNDRN